MSCSACATPSATPAVAGEIERLGRRAVRRADGRHAASIRSRAAVEAALAAAGRIDILVNNAGLGPENAAEDVTEADFDLTCAVNLKGTFFVSQAVGRAMIAQGGGHDRQSRLAGGRGRAAGRGGLLHDEGRDPPPHALPGDRVGRPRHHGQRRRADVHRHARHGAGARRSRPSAPTCSSGSRGCTASASRWTSRARSSSSPRPRPR